MFLPFTKKFCARNPLAPNSRSKEMLAQPCISYFVPKYFSKNVQKEIYVPLQELQKSYTRSSGPGGQNVNKVNTKVELRFKVSEAFWMPYDVRERIIQSGKYLNKEGEMIVTSDKSRTQEMNQQDAYNKLKYRVNEFAAPPKERKKFVYKEPEVIKQKRVNFKRQRSDIKSRRGNQTGRRGDW